MSADAATLSRLVPSMIERSRASPSLLSEEEGEEGVGTRAWLEVCTEVGGGGALLVPGAVGLTSCTKNHLTAQGDPRWFSSRAYNSSSSSRW